MYQRIENYKLNIIHVMRVATRANFILIRKRLVGIPDVWVNALYHAFHHALQLVPVDV